MSIIYLMANRHMFYVDEHRTLAYLPRNLETVFLRGSDKYEEGSSEELGCALPVQFFHEPK